MNSNPAIFEMILTSVMENQMIAALQFIEDEIRSGDRKVLPDDRIYYKVTIEDKDKASKALKIVSLAQIIAKRHHEVEDLIKLDKHINELNESIGLKPETIKEIKYKISSRIAQCDISIRDHSKLLNDE